jgi:hypothetical protein
VRDVVLDHDISKYTDQIQGCMWITGRKRWHFAMYCPALEVVGKDLYWRVIERDEAYIEAMEAELVEFMRLVDSYERKLRAQPAVNAGQMLEAA